MEIKPQMYPILRFMDGYITVLEVDASAWPTPQTGQAIRLNLKDGTPHSSWLVGEVTHEMIVRKTGDDEALTGLPLSRITTIELLRLGGSGE